MNDAELSLLLSVIRKYISIPSSIGLFLITLTATNKGQCGEIFQYYLVIFIVEKILVHGMVLHIQFLWFFIFNSIQFFMVWFSYKSVGVL